MTKYVDHIFCAKSIFFVGIDVAAASWAIISQVKSAANFSKVGGKSVALPQLWRATEENRNLSGRIVRGGKNH
jgi:hypothetical protein